MVRRFSEVKKHFLGGIFRWEQNELCSLILIRKCNFIQNMIKFVEGSREIRIYYVYLRMISRILVINWAIQKRFMDDRPFTHETIFIYGKYVFRVFISCLVYGCFSFENLLMILNGRKCSIIPIPHFLCLGTIREFFSTSRKVDIWR